MAAPQRRGAHHTRHARLLFHGKQPGKAHTAQKRRGQRVCGVARVRHVKQAQPACVVHHLAARKLCGALGPGQHALVGAHFALKAVVAHHQGRIFRLRKAARSQRTLQLHKRPELFALLFQPAQRFGPQGALHVLHVIAIVNFVRVNIAFRLHGVIHLVSAEQAQNQRRAAHAEQLEQLGAKGCGARAGVPGPKAPQRRGRAQGQLLRGLQPAAHEHKAKQRAKHRAAHHRRGRRHHGQRQRLPKPV